MYKCSVFFFSKIMAQIILYYSFSKNYKIYI